MPARARVFAIGLLTALVLAAGLGGPARAGSGWPGLLERAEGQEVFWNAWGGDERINAYIAWVGERVAAEHGITLRHVKLSDTAEAVARVLAEKAAGKDEGGSIDLIWINGENFANGVEAGLWREGWATRLPNAALVDPATVEEDFGVRVEGRESPWSRALFVLAHDAPRLPEPPRSLDELRRFAEEHPGRFTYPAPPDFTGSAFVRQVVAALGEDEAFTWLTELQPLLWEEGRTFPADEAELNELFANGEVDITMSYDPAFVQTAVAQGRFPATARPFVLDEGTLQNTSYVAMPVTAPNPAAALVLANLLLDPNLQAIKADPEVLGVPTVLDLDRLDEAQQALFATVTDSPYLLTDYGTLVDELPADSVEAIEQRWVDEVRGS